LAALPPALAVAVTPVAALALAVEEVVVEVEVVK
jgi:hypothetical protein